MSTPVYKHGDEISCTRDGTTFFVVTIYENQTEAGWWSYSVKLGETAIIRSTHEWQSPGFAMQIGVARGLVGLGDWKGDHRYSIDSRPVRSL